MFQMPRKPLQFSDLETNFQLDMPQSPYSGLQDVGNSLSQYNQQPASKELFSLAGNRELSLPEMGGGKDGMSPGAASGLGIGGQAASSMIPGPTGSTLGGAASGAAMGAAGGPVGMAIGGGLGGLSGLMGGKGGGGKKTIQGPQGTAQMGRIGNIYG